MFKIYIDTSDRKIKKVLLMNDANEKIIDSVEGDFDPVPTILQLLEKHNITPAEISLFEPFLGPGSFTGLKNGIAICNVLNWALGKKNINDLFVPNYGSEPNIQPPTN